MDPSDETDPACRCCSLYCRLGGAFAHGSSAAKHGGIVQTANDLQFEMVRKGEVVTVYVDDHGKSRPTAGASGKLTVLSGSQRTEAPLVPTGQNALEARNLTIASGSKIVASIQFADKQAATVRFTVN